MRKLPLVLIPFIIACSNDEEELIKRQQQQIVQLQSQLQTSGVQEVIPALPAPAQYQQQYQQAPVVQEHNDNGLLGGMAGFMLGQALGNNSNNTHSSTIERHYITNNSSNSSSNNTANRVRGTSRLPTTIRQAPVTTQPSQPVQPKPSFWSSKPSISSGSSRPFSSSSSFSSSKPSVRRR